MNSGARMALGVGAGYLLGRTRKMRLAFMVAAAGLTGRIGVTPSELLTQGVRKLLETPELGEITGLVRGELADAVRSAAITATSSRVESLNGRLRPHTDTGAGAEEEDTYDEAEDTEADAEDTEDTEDTEPSEPETKRERTAPRRQHSTRTATASRPARRRTAGSATTPVRRARR